MIEKKNYEELLHNYGNVASWAIWKKPSEQLKSNMKDVSMFMEDGILKELNPNYVFVGLNGSGVHNDYMDNSKPWHNFHSSNPHGHDYKLRYALMNTPYWGAYITDAIKKLPEVDSNKVISYLKKHPEIVKENMENLKREISLLGVKPTLIAMGNQSYDLIHAYLGKEYTVKKIKHYSYTIGKEDYREHVLQVLSDGAEEIDYIEISKITENQNAQKEEVNVTNIVVANRTVNDSAVPTLEEQLEKVGLDIPNNWRGDIRKQLTVLFDTLVKGSDYSIKINESDSTKIGMNLYYKDAERRCMGFEKMDGMMFKIFPTKKFYEELMYKYKVELPAPDPKKSQPHMKVTVKQLWELLYIITSQKL